MSSADVSTENDDDAVEDETDVEREQLVAELTDRLGKDVVIASHIDPGDDLWVRVTNASWGDVAHVLRHDLNFVYFCYLSAIDWLPSPFGRRHDSDVDLLLEGDAQQPTEEMQHGVTGGETRFQMLARVHSLEQHLGVTLKADIPDEDLTVPTWTGVYPGANWHEREAWEMFGIVFAGHPRLRHLYLPTDFQGHPLRKDFPLLARHMKPWPGIVDVEPMPGEDEPDSPADGEGD